MTKAVLLDLGNVVLGVDFRRVFKYWAQATNKPVQIFYDAWQLDDAYKDHEVANIDFATYTAALSEQFGVQMSLQDWQHGWNDIWTQPFHSVIELLPALASRYALYGFSNTNETHEKFWRETFHQHLSSFQKIYTSSNIGLRKPDAQAYDYVCKDMQLEPAKVLFLDDTLENISGALEVGLDAHHVASEAEISAILSRLLQ